MIVMMVLLFDTRSLRVRLYIFFFFLVFFIGTNLISKMTIGKDSVIDSSGGEKII